MARIRSQTYREPSGSYKWVSQDALHITAGGIDSTTTESGSQVCTDFTSARPYPDHTLDITHKRVRQTRYNASSATFYGSARVWKGSLTGWRPGPFGSSNYPSLPSPAWSYYTTKALKNMNPNVPVVDVPVFLFELKDFPRMLKDLGRVLARKVRPSDVPGGYLAYRFGWRPLFQDLATLLNLADSIDRRKKLLLAAQSKGGTRIQRKIGSDQITLADTNFSTSRQGAVIGTGTIRYSGQSEYWYTARLYLKTPLTGDSLDTAVFRAVLGLNLSAASIWEALPWSWLVDYFINIGDFLDANRGFIKFQRKKLNLMCHQQVKGVCSSSYVNPGVFSDDGTVSLWSKGRRLPTLVSPKLALAPFLSGGETAILGALVTANALRKFKL